MSEPQQIVRAGLSRLVAEWPEWSAAPLVLLRNRLLDECGGDARPLIALVMRAAEVGVPDRVMEWNGMPASWPVFRGPLVVAMTAEAFIRQEMATWVIDTWAIALIGRARLGIPADDAPAVTKAERTPRSRPSVPAATPSPRAAKASVPRATSAPRAVLAPVAPSAARPRTTSAPLLTAPPSLAMQRSTRIAGAVIVAGLSFLTFQIVTRDRGERETTTPQQAGFVSGELARVNAERANAGRAGARADSLGGATRVAVTTPGNASPRNVSPTGSALTGLSRGGLPDAANDPSRVLMVRPPTRAQGQVGPGARVLENSVAMLATTNADRVELKSGRLLTGRVEVVRAVAILFRDSESGLRYEIPKSDIQEITTEFGTKVRFSSSGDPTNVRQSPLVAAGVGGRYLVQYEMIGVRGSPECSALHQKPNGADYLDINHVPGADTLVMAIQRGATWNAVVDNSGQFTTVFAIQPDQALSSSAFTSRMAGRFTGKGFDAEVNLIAYRRARVGRDIACQTTLRAIGERQR